MYSINLSILSNANYIPEDHIVNLKQLSDSVVRIQLAKRKSSDKLPVVHNNTIKFAESHSDSLVVDVSMPELSNNVIVKSKNFDFSEDKINKDHGFSIKGLVYTLVKLILKANDLEEGISPTGITSDEINSFMTN